MKKFNNVDDVFAAIENDVKQIGVKILYDISEGTHQELVRAWDEYLIELRRMNPNKKMEIMRKFGITSFDDVGITKVQANGKYRIGILAGSDRLRDARIMEYVLGKKTPHRNTIAKLATGSFIQILVNKR